MVPDNIDWKLADRMFRLKTLKKKHQYSEILDILA